MTIKLPRITIDELERLVDQLTKESPDKREVAMVRLMDYERSGKIPLEVMIDLSQSEHPPLSMYAISALGRNGMPQAVSQLVKLLAKNRQGNPLFLETIIEALGETKSHKASATLLELLGLKTGLVDRWFARRSKKEEEGPEETKRREQMILPVIRALEKIQDPRASEKLAVYLDHSDYLIRWHTLQSILKCGLTEFNAKLKDMSANDQHELVREMADIAYGKLTPLPPELNN